MKKVSVVIQEPNFPRYVRNIFFTKSWVRHLWEYVSEGYGITNQPEFPRDEIYAWMESYDFNSSDEALIEYLSNRKVLWDVAECMYDQAHGLYGMCCPESKLDWYHKRRMCRNFLEKNDELGRIEKVENMLSELTSRARK